MRKSEEKSSHNIDEKKYLVTIRLRFRDFVSLKISLRPNSISFHWILKGYPKLYALASAAAPACDADPASATDASPGAITCVLLVGPTLALEQQQHLLVLLLP